MTDHGKRVAYGAIVAAGCLPLFMVASGGAQTARKAGYDPIVGAVAGVAAVPLGLGVLYCVGWALDAIERRQEDDRV